jgi:hypothetical protein
MGALAGLGGASWIHPPMGLYDGRGSIDSNPSKAVAAKPIGQTSRAPLQSLRPCTQCSSICSAIARSSSDALAMALL